MLILLKFHVTIAYAMIMAIVLSMCVEMKPVFAILNTLDLFVNFLPVSLDCVLVQDKKSSFWKAKSVNVAVKFKNYCKLLVLINQSN